MEPIQKQVAEHIIYSGVDGGGGVEQEEAQGVQSGVEGDGEPPHGEAAALFAEIQSQNVQPAGGAAAAEHQSAGKAHQNAAHHAAGEHVRDHRHGRGGDDGQKQGVGGGTDGGLQEEFPSQRAEGQHKQRDIHEEIQHARQIEGQLQLQRPQHQGTDHLAKTVGAAAVQPLGNDEHVDGGGQQQGAQQSAQQTQPFCVEKLLVHGAVTPFLWCGRVLI